LQTFRVVTSRIFTRCNLKYRLAKTHTMLCIMFQECGAATLKKLIAEVNKVVAL
jgi:hypothetical protein